MCLYDACSKCGNDKQTEDTRLGSHRLRLCPGCTTELRNILNDTIVAWVKNKRASYYRRLNIPEPKEVKNKKKFNLLHPN